MAAMRLLAALALLLFPIRAWGWGSDGHRIVAKIAADNLSPAAQSHVAGILGVTAGHIAFAMETAAVLPDSSFRKKDDSTGRWHFINICLQDARSEIRRRCSEGNCVTDKIDEYSKRLKDGNYDRWGAAGDLAFLIHFVGDVHQPLHAADDADDGGNCIHIDSRLRADTLHKAWDSDIVRGLESSIDSGSGETTAFRLEQTYANEKARDVWIPGHTDDIAWESNQIARADIYAPLHIPVEPCESRVLCNNQRRVELDSDYIDRAEVIAGHQLAKAGFRLASLLNETWVHPTGPSDANAPVPSSKTITGQIIGNRRSKIYAWPGCGSYDTMAPKNRVVFPNRDAAEQAGYRAAYNCP
jgi:nuclease S1